MDHVLAQLDLLPKGDARAAVWDEHWLTIWGDRLRNDVPDSSELIASLTARGDYEALLALVGKMRLRQLQGQLDFDVEYENAIWKVLPSAIASSAQLSLARDELIAAVRQFLFWPPFWGCRMLRAEQPSSDDLNNQIQRAQRAANFNGISLPPTEVSNRYLALQRSKLKVPPSRSLNTSTDRSPSASP